MITCISDLHLSIHNRIDDFKRVLMEQVLPEANKSTKFYILGDIYHDRRPHPLEMNIFREFISKIKVPTVIVVGNHDTNVTATTLDEFIYYNEYVRILKPPVIDICEGVILYLDHDLIEGAKLGPSNINLNIKGSKQLKDLPKKDNGKPIDFYLFGHVHKAQIVRKDPPTLYIGSIERIDFAERNEDKFMFQINEKTKKYGYKKLNIRKMIQIDYDLSDNVTALPDDLKDAIVKVIIKGAKDKIRLFNEGELLESLKPSFKFSISYNVVRENKVSSQAISEERTSAECFKNFAKLKKFTEVEVEKGMDIINEP